MFQFHVISASDNNPVSLQNILFQPLTNKEIVITLTQHTSKESINVNIDDNDVYYNNNTEETFD